MRLELYLDRENLADSDPVIIPYKVVKVRFIALYGMITGSLSAYFSRASYSNIFADVECDHDVECKRSR